MTKDRPKNVAASVRNRLLNIARQRGEDFQLILIQYALERMLFRLSHSEYSEEFVLKGAMLFQVWSGERHRPTRDIDFLGRGEPSETRFQEIFEDICSIEVDDDGLKFDATSIHVRTMKEAEKYQGIRIKLDAFLDSARIPVQVDIGFGDAITPGAIEIDYPVILDFATPKLSAYPRETVVAEKFQAMVMLGISNSRMKDFFDLWKLANKFEFDGAVLGKAIKATFERRETQVPNEMPLALTEEFTNDKQKMVQWNAFINKTGLDAKEHSLDAIAVVLGQFLMPPSKAIAAKKHFEMSWSAGGPWTANG
jgi:predicted nucleotidyltransferase component of viral defense system